MGKLYEQVIVPRLRKEMEEKRAVSDNQYEFRPSRSTENAMEKVLQQVEVERKGEYRYNNLYLLVSLNVKNAFSSARSNSIIRKIKRRQMSVELTSVVQSYPSDR
ncbi:hypothetical protein Zmor_002934 [Zophobas morio]|uniref:Reverse transcriptase domain-containing protein n=1 Tax=Zophobas morio TaxID=2755281 RepID=A0AA38HM07_9CUCU|nr:hypothetical protein Zmor_002934 [Zophobas morio]